MALSVNIEKKISDYVMKLSFDSLSKTIGILGPSESGKTLLFRCIAGITNPDSGRIQINGKNIYDSTRKINLKTKDRKIGYLFSDYALFPTMSVEENITCGYKGKKSFRDKTVEEYIHKYELESVVDARPANLTEEQKLRTALARILIGEPQLMLIDEPFRDQNGALKETLYLVLKKYLKEWNGPYVLAAQDPEEIHKLCEYTVIPGEKVSGMTEALFAQPETLGAAYLTGVQNFSRIEILDEYHVQAVDWGIALRTAMEVTSDITHIGIRCEDFEATENGGQNCLPIRICEKRAGIRGNDYEVKNSEDEQTSLILWKSKNEENCAEALYLPAEKLMLLR